MKRRASRADQMPKAAPIKKKTSGSGWDSDLALLAWLATTVSVFSFLFFYQRGDVLLYGDAVAHINIARRVFDSKTPGLLQLGTVWLPLPHLLMIPFLISNDLWQRGAGGSIPSMVGYVLGVVGIFRLVRGVLSRGAEADLKAQIAAWTATLIYAANPNLIYMQSTAMGEAVYLAFFIWSIFYFNEYIHGDAKALIKCGICLAGACLTRYDGWLVAAVMTTVIVVNFFRKRAINQPGADLSTKRSALAKFVLIAAAAPALWLAYNAIIYRNPLEFENGPYSAKAIERKTESAGNPGHPGSRNLLVAGMYFVKAAEDNLAENAWLQRVWILLIVGALADASFLLSSEQTSRSRTVWTKFVLLLLPVPFYALSVAYGGVPIFIPTWWPHSYYNLRYGLQLLPAFAVATAVVLYFVISWRALNTRLRLAAVLLVGVFVIASNASVWKVGPISLKEAQVNMRTRNQLEKALAEWLKRLPPDATLLMYLGDHVGALEQAGIPLRHVINEGNHRVWKQPSDPEGLWERALANPSGYADYAVAFEGDPVWQAVNQQHLHALVELHVTGQAHAIIYRLR
jgi:hypothetical protein